MTVSSSIITPDKFNLPPQVRNEDYEVSPEDKEKWNEEFTLAAAPLEDILSDIKSCSEAEPQASNSYEPPPFRS